MINRRSFLTGLGLTAIAAPAIIRTPGLLMPVKNRWSVSASIIMKGHRFPLPDELVRAAFEASIDAMIYGTSWTRIDADGRVRRIPPTEWQQ